MNEAEVVKRRLEAAAKLVVRPEVHPSEADGTWSHYPSGETNHPLVGHLLSIAACYEVRGD